MVKEAGFWREGKIVTPHRAVVVAAVGAIKIGRTCALFSAKLSLWACESAAAFLHADAYT